MTVTTIWMLGTNLGPLQEQQVVPTTKPSLQPHKDRFSSASLNVTCLCVYWKCHLTVLSPSVPGSLF